LSALRSGWKIGVGSAYAGGAAGAPTSVSVSVGDVGSPAMSVGDVGAPAMSLDAVSWTLVGPVAGGVELSSAWSSDSRVLSRRSSWIRASIF
jgi:hypothetical protein